MLCDYCNILNCKSSPDGVDGACNYNGILYTCTDCTYMETILSEGSGPGYAFEEHLCRNGDTWPQASCCPDFKLRNCVYCNHRPVTPNSDYCDELCARADELEHQEFEEDEWRMHLAREAWHHENDGKDDIDGYLTREYRARFG